MYPNSISAAIGPGQCYLVNETKREGEITAMMERLNGRIADVEKAAAELEQRLGPIMRPVPAQPSTAPSGQEGVSTGMGNALLVQGDRIGSVYDRLTSILRLLEI